MKQEDKGYREPDSLCDRAQCKGATCLNCPAPVCVHDKIKGNKK